MSTKKKPIWWVLLGCLVGSLIVLGFSINTKLTPASKVTAPSNLQYTIIGSIHPNNEAKPFKQPVLGEDPSIVIKQHDESLGQWFEEKRKNPQSAGVRTTVYPFAEMRQTTDSAIGVNEVWLEDSEPFRGVVIFEPYFSLRLSEKREFIFKGLINGQEIRFRQIGTSIYNNSYKVLLGRGERWQFEFETTPLSKGSHNLGFFFFLNTTNNNPDPGVQYDLGHGLRADVFKVNVGTTSHSEELEFFNWGVGPEPTQGRLQDYFGVNNTRDGFVEEGGDIGIPSWKPQLYKPGEEVEYTIVFNNPGSKDREYCLVGFLNYEITPINGQNRICGIVKANQFGLIRAKVKLPSVIRHNYFQILSIENPMMKTSYSQSNRQELSQYISSGRILLTTQ
jgi:hypothetical protein